MPEMVWRINIWRNSCWVSGNKKSDIATYDQRYHFRIWPWTDVEASIQKLKKRMMWECEIVMKQSQDVLKEGDK